jgi:hypothetical protein
MLASDYVEEFCALVYVFTSASRRKHVMGEMKYVFPLLAVRVKKSFSPPPRAFDRVRMSPSPLINESDRLVHSAVCVAVGFQNPVRRPAVIGGRNAGFDPDTNNSHQGTSGSVRNAHKEGLAGLPFDTAKHHLSFQNVSRLVLAPTELPFVELDSLVRTADLLQAAKDVLQHYLSAKLASISKRS